MVRIAPPEFGTPLPAARPSREARELLRLRRSTPADHLIEPGPDADQLYAILEIAARVPDHRRVCPYRFILFEGDNRRLAGDILKRVYQKNAPDAPPERLEIEKKRFLRAPVVVAVVSSVDPDHRTPEWEQILTAGAVCQNMLIAASAHGFAAQWITEWCAYDREALAAFGLKNRERVAGFIYIGTAKEPPHERQRPALDALVSRFEK